MQKHLRVVAVVSVLSAIAGCSAILGINDGKDRPDQSGGDSAVGDDATLAADGTATDGNTGGDARADAQASGDGGMVTDADAAPTPDCVEAGIDTQSSTNNCGACGHSCLGAGCEAGVCDSKTIAVSEAVGMLASNDTYVFWTGGGAIRRATISGAPAQTITNTGLPNGGFALDATRLYYSDRSNAWVESVGINGGPVTVIARGGYPTGVALDATNVYWVNGDRGVDGTSLFAPKTTVDGGAEQQISSEIGPAYPVYATLSDGYIYWLSINDGSEATTKYVRRAPLGVGLVSLQPIVTATGIRGFAVDSQYVYYAVPLGYIARVKLDGSDFTILIDNTDPNEVSVSNDEIFWSTVDTKVMKARKSDGTGRVTLYAHPVVAQRPAFTVGTQYVFLSPTGSEVIRVPR
jgi:hypothetical protein